jgi:hypothetical protein
LGIGIVANNTSLKFFAVDTAGNEETVRVQTYMKNNGSGDVTPPTTAVDPAGGTYNPPVNVTLIPDETAVVYYTTDGSTPDNGSTVYSSAINISENTTLMFFAADTAGNLEAVRTEEYVMTDEDVTPPTTTADPPGGTYYSPVSVTLTPNETATVYYTTDGLTPDTGSTVYASAIDISENTTLMFFGVDTAGNEEAVKTKVYVFADPDETPPITMADPAGGTYASAVSVTLTPNETATVYYTTDGSTPDTGSTVYESPISISENTTLKFFGKDTAGNVEDVKTEEEEYVITAGDPPSITSITPDSADPGTEVTIAGANFGSSGTVTFHNGKVAQTTNWGDTSIICVVPAQAETGDVTVTTGAGTSNGVLFTVTGDPSWEFLGLVKYEGAVLAGSKFAVEIDDAGESISVTAEGGSEALTAKAKQAVERAPIWVKAPLIETLAGMSTSDQNSNADKILNASDPYVDEWAFLVAHGCSGVPSLIDEIAEHLLYVQVVNYGTSADPDYYTTLKYALKDVSSGQAVWIELPKKIYYMYLVARSSESKMRSNFFTKNEGGPAPAIKTSVGKDADHPAKYICMTDWAGDDGTYECLFRSHWWNNDVPWGVSPVQMYPQSGVG